MDRPGRSRISYHIVRTILETFEVSYDLTERMLSIEAHYYMVRDPSDPSYLLEQLYSADGKPVLDLTLFGAIARASSIHT